MNTAGKNSILAVLVSTALLFGSGAMAHEGKRDHGKGDRHFKPHKEMKHKQGRNHRVEKHVYHYFDGDYKPRKYWKKSKYRKHYRRHHHGYGHRHGHGKHHVKRYDYSDRYGYYDDHDGRIRFSISYYDWF